MSVYLYAILGAQPASCGNGVCAEPLRLVVSGDLVAVVGDVPDTPELTAMTLRAQDGVLRRLAAAVDAVLPARFGTLLADDAAVTEALARRRGPLAQALGRVAGCEQMTVRVWGDGAATAPAAESATGGGPGTRYLAQRRQAQEQAQRGAGGRYVAVVDDARDALRPWRVSVTGPWLPYAFGEDAA